jgi:hypothetical protein
VVAATGRETTAAGGAAAGTGGAIEAAGAKPMVTGITGTKS